MTVDPYQQQSRRFPHVSNKKTRHVKYQRVILKISGEILGKGNQLLDPKAIDYITKQIALVHSLGTKLGVVIGGGNIVRGREMRWLNKIDADLCGMIATMINGIVLGSQLRKNKVVNKLGSGIELDGIVRRCNKFEDVAFFNSGGVLIFVGGTGNPLFTTDTAAALRAVELDSDIVIKGTKVEGVYSADPKKNRKATLYRTLQFDEAIEKNLAVMDSTAFTICKEASIPICVYNFMKYPLSSIIRGKDVGTLITNGGKYD